MMNQDSSRSHSIFTITIEMTDKYDPVVAAAAGNDKENHIRVCIRGVHACTMGGRKLELPVGLDSRYLENMVH
jgi:hypothetical protein